MARGIVSINTYDRRVAPNSTATPYVRATDVDAGVAQGLASLGEGLRDVGRANLEVERLRVAREEDDARVYVSAAMARARASASEIRRRALAEAPDGWRGATERVSREWGELRETALRDAPTPSAALFLGQAFDQYQPLMLEDVAAEEERSRSLWQVDSVRESLRVEGSAIAADPRLYDSAIAQQRELINGMAGLDANTRRDLLAAMEGEFAATAVAGMIERDPSAMLRALRDPDAGGPIAGLSGEERIRFSNQAQAEIDRRAARWRASVREQVDAARTAGRLGVSGVNWPSVDNVRAALGAAAAAEYEAEMLAFSDTSDLQRLTNAELARIAATPPPESASVQERLRHAAGASAAAAIIERRRDPVSYATQRGLLSDSEEMAEAINEGNLDLVGVMVRRRTAIVREQAAELGAPVAPLNAAEADGLRRLLAAMPAEQRRNALAQLRDQNTARGVSDVGAYNALIRQLYPVDSDAASLAGAAVLGARGRSVEVSTFRNGRTEGRGSYLDADTVSRRMLEGANLLRRDRGGESEGEGEGRRPPTLSMPSNEALEGAFREYVGDAYAGDPQRYSRAFEAFRAYYAGAVAETGINGNGLRYSLDMGVNGDEAAVALAGEAAAAAVGEMRVNREPGPGLPERVYLPWGMNEDEFLNRIERGWPAIQAAFPGAELSRDPSAYDYAPDPGAPGTYRVFRDGRAVVDQTGAIVRIRP